MRAFASPSARTQPIAGSDLAPLRIYGSTRQVNSSLAATGPVVRSPNSLGDALNSKKISGARPSRTQHKRSLQVRAEAGPSGNLVRMPIFPLSVVALPAANTPLQIFEARYRVLFSTLLAGLDNVEDGLVSPDKPWKGTRRFGMAFFNQQANGLATVGTVLEITEHSLLEDGRLLINTVGRERFRIENIVEERPVLVCDVEVLQEDNVATEEARELAEEVAELFRNVVKLSVKLKEAPVPPELAEPSQLTTLSPSELSFWVASLFAGNPFNQQSLLEEDSTMKRLKTEQDMLSSTLKYLSAQAALQSAFGGSGSSGEAE